MNLRETHPTFHSRGQGTNPYRLIFWVVLILAAVWVLRGLQSGTITSPLAPTPTPTRTAKSWVEEAAARFSAGDLQGAIDAYREALRLEPENAELWAELARIQTYSSSLMTTRAQRVARLQDAMASIDRAVELSPDDPTILAIRALVLDWNASYAPDQKTREALLTEAEVAAKRALTLQPEHPLALAYYAEVLVDEQQWSQAEQFARRAVELAPDLMDAHRVYATVMVSLGQYNLAIQEYLKAAEITPNLTFLYINIGVNYRHLEVYNEALRYFDKAAKINKQNGIEDPLPYIAIAKTYSQMGEFFIAARNAERAIEIDPTNANTYGQLGIIYVKSRNYEGALPVLKCAVEGCTAAENEVGGVAVEPLPLDNLTVAFYYAQYGSLLAAFDQCDHAMQVLEEVEQAFPDPLILGIVQENRAICGG